jgi:hypothetical protein
MKASGCLKYLLLCSALYISGCTDSTKQEPQKKTILLDTVLPASNNEYASADQSPMDMSYFPPGYPLQKMKGKDSTGGPLARVIYSRPHKKGRIIFGNTDQSLCKYGKEWRLGANEASEIEFFRDAIVAGRTIPKGRYIIYCIPYPERWTIVLNKNLYTWGLHMDPMQDFFKTDIPVMELNPRLEDFTMVFLPATHGADLLMAWDNVKAILPISFSK